MAKVVLTDAFISVAGNDISAYCNAVTLEYGADTPEKSGFGDGTHLMAAGGAKNWSLGLQANNDFAAAALDSILFPLVGTEVAIILRPTSAVVGAGNPEFTGQGVVANYSPLAGSFGDLAATPLNIVAAGTLARATS